MRSPDHHDAELVIKLYDLRREPTMRDSRDALIRDFLPRRWEDVEAVSSADHPLNRAYRQVSSYWEMAYSLIRFGALDADLAMESNGEGMLLLARVHPYLERLRSTVNPRAFRNAEWVATETEAGRRVFAVHVERYRRTIGT